MQDVIRSYGDGDLDDLTRVIRDEFLRLGQLRSLSIWTYPATDHRGGRLTRAAQFLELEPRIPDLQGGIKVVNVAPIGDLSILIALGERITQRQVIGRGWRIRGRGPGRCQNSDRKNGGQQDRECRLPG